MVPPDVRAEIVGPDRRIVEVDLPPPLPPVAPAECREAEEESLGRLEDVLLGAADPRRRDVRLPQGPLRREGLEGPDLGALLAAAALVVAAVADENSPLAVPGAGSLVAGRSQDRLLG